MSQFSLTRSSNTSLSSVEWMKSPNPLAGYKSKPSHPIPLWSHIYEHITTFAHVCIVGVSVYLIYLSLEGDFAFLNWHPLLYTIGWMLLMYEAVLMLVKENIFANRITYKWRVRAHWLLQTGAIAFSLAGFAIGVVFKDNIKLPHFATDHSLIGLIATAIIAFPTLFTGITALFSSELRNIIPAKINKLLHAFCGIVGIILGTAAMILGLYTAWFVRKTNGSEATLVVCYIAIIFGTAWTLLRPVITATQRVTSYC